MAQQLPSYEAMQQAYGQQPAQGGVMGLLSSPMGQGLLGAGLGALASRGTTAQAIGRGGLLGLSAFGQAQGQQQNRIMQMAQAKIQQDALAALRPGEDGSISATPAQFMAAGFTDPAKWTDIRNLGRDKFKQMQEVTNADGSKSMFSVNEYGGIQGTGLTNAPEIKTQDLGGKVVGLNAYTGQQAWGADKAATIAERESARHNRASEGIQYGNLALSRDRLAFDQQQPRGQVVDTPSGLMVVDPRTGQAAPVRSWDGAPLGGKAKAAVDGPEEKRRMQAESALSIISEAESLIDKATGSYVGAAADGVARAFGASPKSAQASAQLKALEGALMMAQPRMEGPQSDKDVALYRQMAGQIGDSTVPAPQKRAALDVIKRLHQRHAGAYQPQSTGGGRGGASGSWGDDGKSPSATHVDDLLNKYR